MSYFMMDGTAMSAPMSGYGGYGIGYYGGFGAIDFNSDAVWSDWLAGASGNNAAGMRAANAIRAALGQLGFGPGQSIDASWGTATDKSSYTAFASQQGIPAPGGMPVWWPSKTGLIKLGELVKAGGAPGGQPVAEFHDVGGKVVPGAAPGAKPLPGTAAAKTAGLSTGAIIGIGALAVVAIGAIAVMASKKKPSGAPSRAAPGPAPAHRAPAPKAA